MKVIPSASGTVGSDPEAAGLSAIVLAAGVIFGR